MLKATFTESLEPSLCRQKEFVYEPKLSLLRHKWAHNQSRAVFFQSIRDAVIFDFFHFYINHIFLAICYVLTISSDES